MNDIHSKLISRLEEKTEKHSHDITKLKTNVGHIQDEMSDLKTMAIDNAKANQNSELSHKDTNTRVTEFFSFMKGAIWVIGVIVTGITIAIQLIK